MRSVYSAARTAAAALVLLSFASHAAATKLLRFPDVWHDRIVFSYAGDLWTVGTRGGTAARLTSNPGLVLSGAGSARRTLGLRQSGLRLDAGRHGRVVQIGARRLHADGFQTLHGADE